MLYTASFLHFYEKAMYVSMRESMLYGSQNICMYMYVCVLFVDLVQIKVFFHSW